MIPVRVPADVKVPLASERRFAAHRGHPVDPVPCPVCDIPVGEKVSVLVVVGIAPENREPAGFVATGGAVMVHAACAGVPEEEPDRALSP